MLVLQSLLGYVIALLATVFALRSSFSPYLFKKTTKPYEERRLLSSTIGSNNSLTNYDSWGMVQILRIQISPASHSFPVLHS